MIPRFNQNKNRQTVQQCSRLTLFSWASFQKRYTRKRNVSGEGIILLCLAVGTWSGWVYTIRKPTGTWAISLTGDLCSSSVMDIECQLADGSSVQLAGQVIHCKERIGIYCRNSEQIAGKQTCADYRFRFLCSTIEKPGEYLFLMYFRFLGCNL